MVFVLLNFVHEESHLSVFNSVFKMIYHLQGNFFGAIFFDYDGLFPGRMKFYFLEPCPTTREFPGEYSVVTTEYPLVKYNFILQGDPPTREFPGEYSMVMTEYSLENIQWL